MNRDKLLQFYKTLKETESGKSMEGIKGTLRDPLKLINAKYKQSYINLPEFQNNKDVFIINRKRSPLDINNPQVSEKPLFLAEQFPIPTLFEDADSFGSHALIANRNLTTALFTDGDTFGTHTINPSLSTTLFTDGDAYGTHQIDVSLPMTIFTDGDAYETHVVDVSLPMTIFADGDTFGTHEAIMEPTEILGSKLKGWYDFSDTSVLYTTATKTTAVSSDGDTIGACEDKSSSGAGDITSGRGSESPIYRTSGVFSKSSAEFDGVNDQLSTAGTFVAVTDPHTVITVLESDGSAGTIFDNTNRSGYTIVNRDSGGSQSSGSIYVSAGVDADTVTSYPSTASWKCEVLLDNSGGDEIRADNATADSLTVGAGGMDANEGIAIGNGVYRGPFLFGGYIGEQLIIQGTLTSTERADLYRYLDNKWGT